jgi:phospholipase C
MKDPRIEHIIVLMMENRSFDHMIGFLKRENPEIRGIMGGDYSNADADGTSFPVTDGARYQGDFTVDTGHDFADVDVQLYSDKNLPPDMSGFVKNYDGRAGKGAGSRVMKCFTPDQVPVISALAREYAIADQWFSSVPGPTLPNRAFAHFGTSFGRLDMSPEYLRARPSIYHRLRNSNVKSKIYYYAKWSGTQGLTFLLDDQRSFFGLWGDFKDDCLNNRLPAYSFVEPPYSDNGGTIAADQHPDHSVRAGDDFIGEVYAAIRSNPAVWNTSLLLVVWDEHGGFFDHERPPMVQADAFESTAPPFEFDRLGVRVPAVVVSPYVAPGTVDHTVYEHASIPATVAEQFLPNPELIKPFPREQAAHTFLQLLTLDKPRQDMPSFAAAPHVPVPQDGAKVSDLLRHQVNEVYGVLTRNFPAVARQLDPASVKTEGDAKKFIATGMDAIHRDPSPGGGGQ